MVRIRDVAAKAGVSTATVSRVLNGKTVRADLTEAVLGAVEELGYVPHATARALRRGHSDVIALVVPDVENPFFTTIARAVEDVAQLGGYSVVLCNTDDDPEKEQRYLDIALRENMAGVILAPADEEPALASLLDRGRAVVIIDRLVKQEVDHITFDNVELGRRATRSLLERGHVNIACITGPHGTSTAVERAQGWRRELSEAGHDVRDDWLRFANFRVDGGRTATEELVTQGILGGEVTAVLATNNLVGVGVLQALATESARVEVGIIGDLPFATSDLSRVSVTSLAPAELGRRAAERLLKRINDEDLPPEYIVSEISL